MFVVLIRQDTQNKGKFSFVNRRYKTTSRLSEYLLGNRKGPITNQTCIRRTSKHWFIPPTSLVLLIVIYISDLRLL